MAPGDKNKILDSEQHNLDRLNALPAKWVTYQSPPLSYINQIVDDLFATWPTDKRGNTSIKKDLQSAHQSTEEYGNDFSEESDDMEDQDRVCNTQYIRKDPGYVML